MLTGKSCAAWREAKDLQWKANIEVTLKKEVNDPQGSAVENSLKALGFNEVEQVRVGKYIELTINASTKKAAAGRVEEMSRRLLSNPVIEDFKYTLQEVD